MDDVSVLVAFQHPGRRLTPVGLGANLGTPPLQRQQGVRDEISMAAQHRVIGGFGKEFEYRIERRSLGESIVDEYRQPQTLPGELEGLDAPHVSARQELLGRHLGKPLRKQFGLSPPRLAEGPEHVVVGPLPTFAGFGMSDEVQVSHPGQPMISPVSR